MFKYTRQKDCGLGFCLLLISTLSNFLVNALLFINGMRVLYMEL